jgi:TatD DNase family protein
MLIDTHCHLDAAEFNGQQDTIVTAAQSVGVGALVVPAVECANFAAVETLCARHAMCVPAYGIHPMYVDRVQADDLEILRARLAQPNVVAVGEIGLDFFMDGHDREKQERYFVAQLKLAREFNLPVLLHIRRAQDTILKYLRRIRVVGGIAHAFNGSRQQAEEFIKLGFKLGFGGAMTYARATQIRALAAGLPLESIVLETDAPDIPPAFLARGIPNEPKYLPRIAETLAALRGMSVADVARVTTENAARVLPQSRLSKKAD